MNEQLGENLRFYGDMRFKQLTLLMAWLSAAAFGVLSFNDKQPAQFAAIVMALPHVTLAFIAILWIMEVRSTIHWAAHRLAMPELWPTPKRPFWSILSASNAVALWYFLMFVSWLWLAHSWQAPMCGIAAWSVVGVLLLIFNVVNYVRTYQDRTTAQPVAQRAADIGGGTATNTGNTDAQHN